MVMGGESTDSTPVEQVLLFDAGTVAVSAAGPILRVWDLVAGGRCLRAFSNHQKTITSLTFGSGGKRLLTGSLDHMVKVYDVETYRVMHTMRYPSPILCLAISVRAIIFHSILFVFTSIIKAGRDTYCRWNVRWHTVDPSSTAEVF